MSPNLKRKEAIHPSAPYTAEDVGEEGLERADRKRVGAEEGAFVWREMRCGVLCI